MQSCPLFRNNWSSERTGRLAGDGNHAKEPLAPLSTSLGSYTHNYPNYSHLHPKCHHSAPKKLLREGGGAGQGEMLKGIRPAWNLGVWCLEFGGLVSFPSLMEAPHHPRGEQLLLTGVDTQGTITCPSLTTSFLTLPGPCSRSCPEPPFHVTFANPSRSWDATADTFHPSGPPQSPGPSPLCVQSSASPVHWEGRGGSGDNVLTAPCRDR